MSCLLGEAVQRAFDGGASFADHCVPLAGGGTAACGAFGSSFTACATSSKKCHRDLSGCHQW